MTSQYDLDQIGTRMDRWAEAGLRAFDDSSAWLLSTVASPVAAYTIQPFDRYVLADATGGAFTCTLPDARNRRLQQPITVKRLNGGGNAVTVGSAGGTIDGAATVILAAQYATKVFVSDGSVWHIVGSV